MNIPRTYAAPAILLSALLAAATALADPTRAEVEASLSGYEQGPAPATVQGWGSSGVTLLMELARDTSGAPAIRARAAHALRLFPADARVHAFLRSTAAETHGDLFVRRACFDALVAGFDDVVEVARYLAAPAVDLRDGAAWSLASSRNPAARAALAERLRVETDPTVRITLSQALGPSSPPTVTTVAAPPSTVTLTAPPRARRTRTARSR